ncbi:MAG: hypothetical protein HY316_10635 [Acidobacteria bacterium]|nr:hypothetical protein [Acidobacteriota bacterium]
MPECDSLLAGAGSIGLGLLLLYKCVSRSYDAKLAARLPVSSCGAAQEGLRKATGHAVSAASLASPLLGVPCLVSQIDVEAYEGSGNDAKWKSVHQETQSVPFYVEDQTGRLWVDPSEAEFFLLSDVEFSTEKRWKPKPGQLVKFGETEITAEMLEQRVRRYYQQRTASEAHKKKLRFTEKNLMAGDPVTVIGPAYATPGAQPGTTEIKFHKVHPDDSFVIGDGPPQEIAARMQKQVLWMRWAGIGFAAVGVAMVLSCFFEH